MDRKIFGKGMAILTACYPDYDLKDETTGSYWEFLRHLSSLDFERAVKRHVTTCKWFPKVSEILQAVQDHLPTPIDVWNRLIAAAEAGKKPEMDAATMKAMRFIGAVDTASNWQKTTIVNPGLDGIVGTADDLGTVDAYVQTNEPRR